MKLKTNQAVRFLKAAYGLTLAPRLFYLLVPGLGLEHLQTEPCLWRLRRMDAQSQTLRTIGLVGSHVADFL